MTDVGKKLLPSVIDRIKTAVPAGLEELAQLGRTLEKRRDDILAWFDHPGSSNGPTEAINGRLEHLRGIALGFRNLVNYRLRSLLEAGGFRPLIHSLS
jgi:transposase